MRIITITLMIALPTSGVSFAQEAPTRSPGDLGWVWVEAYIGQSPSFFLTGQWFNDRTGQWVREIGWVFGNGFFHRGWIYVPENDLHNFRGRVISPYKVFVDGMVESSTSVSGWGKKTGWISVPLSGIVVHGRLFIPSAERDVKDRRQREWEEKERKQREEVERISLSFFVAFIVAFILAFIYIIKSRFFSGRRQEKEAPKRVSERSYQEETACGKKDIHRAQQKETDSGRLETHIQADHPRVMSLDTKLATREEVQVNGSSPQGNTAGEKKNNPMAFTGFILGLVSMPFFGIGIIPVLAVVFSSIALATFKPEIQKNKWMAGIGLALGVIYTIMSLTHSAR